MGQERFFPPTVKGWDGGPAWISTASLTARHRFAEELLERVPAGQRGRWLASLLRRIGAPEEAGEAVDALSRLLLGLEVTGARREQLAGLLGGARARVRPDRPEGQRGLMQVLAALLKAPEYQLC